jgi:hypothetical protein
MLGHNSQRTAVGWGTGGGAGADGGAGQQRAEASGYGAETVARAGDLGLLSSVGHQRRGGGGAAAMYPSQWTAASERLHLGWIKQRRHL